MNAEQLAEQYISVSQAATACRRDTNFVYRQLNKGTLTGLCIAGKWFVHRDSVKRFADVTPPARRVRAAQAVAN